MKKYPRTFHFKFSQGTTNDDKIADTFDNVLSGEVVFTEKLDGENIMLSKEGIFSRSRSTTTDNPWNKYLKPFIDTISHKLGDLEIYGESLFAVHSIEYSGLDSYFYVFGIRDRSKNSWLSWDDVKFYSDVLELPTVPVLFITPPDWKVTPEELEKIIGGFMNTTSELSDNKFWLTPKEGVVVRVKREIMDDEFNECLFKFVRQDHVKTDEHWTKKWKRAHLRYDLERILK